MTRPTPIRFPGALALGELMIKRRAELDLSQIDVALAAGCSQNAICLIENYVPGGKDSTGVALELAMKISDLLGISLDHIRDQFYRAGDRPTLPHPHAADQTPVVARAGPDRAPLSPGVTGKIVEINGAWLVDLRFENTPR